MIGYRSIQHQGWATAKVYSIKEWSSDDEHNPYPRGCAAFYEYQDGCNGYRSGKVIDCRGHVVGVGTQSHKHADVHRQGTGW